MKKNEVPQDATPLEKFTKEMCYAVNESGKYETALSTGWQVKADALGITWEEAKTRVEEALQKVKNGQASPLLFFMELNLMDVSIVAAYTGFWKWTVRQHLKPHVFEKLSEKKLRKYAVLFNVSVEELKKMSAHGTGL